MNNQDKKKYPLDNPRANIVSGDNKDNNDNKNNMEIIMEGLNKCFFTSKDKDLYQKRSYGFNSWFFDFKKITLNSIYINAFAEEFVKKYKNQYPFVIGGMEVSSINLIGAILQKMYDLNIPTRGFFVRKGRKKYDLLNLIEGDLKESDTVIIIDDGFNSGSSVIKVLEALKSFGNIRAVEFFCILSYKDTEYIKEFEKIYNIKINYLFYTGDILPALLKDREFVPHKYQNNIKLNPYKQKFRLVGEHPNLYYVIPKSGPVFYKDKIYYGLDNGAYRCVDRDGNIVWQFEILMKGELGKNIFSTAIIVNNKVCFGAYDGLLYCLDSKTGKLIWKNYDCDWIGSSPDYDSKNNRFVVGCEYGFWAKKGGVLSVDANTGETIWVYRGNKDYTHASPLYVKKYNYILCGSNSGDIVCLNAQNGDIVWQYKTTGDIKYKMTFDNKNIVYFADLDNNITALNINTGSIVWNYKMFFGSYCQPMLNNNVLYVTSFDKHVYALDATSGQLIWKTYLKARIFSTAFVYDNKVFVGNNEGVLYILNSKDGSVLGTQINGERITNKITISEDHKEIYVLDYANTLTSFILTDI